MWLPSRIRLGGGQLRGVSQNRLFQTGSLDGAVDPAIPSLPLENAIAAPPETVTLDKWFRQAEPRLGRKSKFVQPTSTFVWVEEAVTLDTWLRQEHGKWVRRPFRNNASNVLPLLDLGLEVIENLDWLTSVVQRRRRPAPSAQQASTQAFTDLVAVLQWQPHFVDRVRAKIGRNRAEGASGFVPVVVPSDWFTPSVVKPRTRKRPVQPSQSSQTAALHPFIFADWFQPSVQPRRVKKAARKLQNIPFPWSAIADAYIVKMDWFVAPRMPKRKQRRAQPFHVVAETYPIRLFAETGPLYLNGSHVNGGQSLWRSRGKKDISPENPGNDLYVDVDYWDPGYGS